MVGNNFVYTQFKRRRRSNPTSPTSPTFTRRPLDRQDGFLQVSSPADLPSASTLNSESPALDIDVPSPTFDLSAFEATSPVKELPNTNNARLGRSSDDYGQYKRPLAAEFARPATSAAPAPLHTKFSPVTTGSPSTTSPPNPSSMRQSFEHLGTGTHSQDWRSRFYDQQGPTQRNFSTSSLATDRSPIEDFGSSKNQAPKKNRFLRNPMGILARRKSSQPGSDDFGLTINTSGLSPLPTGDVSIRGTRIHDFNAPRPRRIYSNNDVSSGENSPRESRPSMQDHRRSSDLPNLPSSPGQRSSQSPKHSPMFKEHFNDDRRALQPSHTAYLHALAASQNANADVTSSNMPEFARRLPARLPENARSSIQNRPKAWHHDGEVNMESVTTLPVDALKDSTPSPPPPTPPPKEPLSPELDLPPISQLPKHMTSTSSRFSFQIGGQGSSAQERILEEKHKQHQASKKLAGINGEDEADEDDFGDYDFDDDGLEERIPGVNADAEDEEVEDGNDFEEPIPGVNIDAETGELIEEFVPNESKAIRAQTAGGYDGFHFTPQAAVFSPTQTHSGSIPTPRDDKGYRVGIADSKDSPGLFNSMQAVQMLNQAGEEPSLAGLGITAQQHDQQPAPGGSTQVQPKKTSSFDDEDLYFDDGDFDEIMGEEHGDFDEEIFDDETGKIHDIPAQNAKRMEEAQRAHEANLSGLKRLSLSEETGAVSERPKSLEQAEEAKNTASVSGSNRLSAFANPGAPSSLTERNLEYHHALVAAANDAAAKGRFSRNVSFSRYSEDQSSQSQLDDSQQCLTSDESRLSHNLEHSGIAEDDGFPFDDDAYDDDLMIAEANAEVLENDDEGFYGEEFGFYARAKGKGGSDLVNGGYFGPRGANGVKRSHSAKANFPEPTLTPITERSEWSTRNSVASLQIPGGIPGSAHSLPSPGIAQLLEFEPGNYEDPEMSFSALAKLRGRTFGGSSTSLNSMGTSLPGTSPLSYVPHHVLPNVDTNHRMGSSIHSLTGSAGIPESEEEEEDHYGVPTLTQSTPMKKKSESPVTPQNNVMMSPSVSGWDGKHKISHSRTSSGAESVSYVRDPDGSGRWLLERRRTGDDGELEVIGREYLAGARI